MESAYVLAFAPCKRDTPSYDFFTDREMGSIIYDPDAKTFFAYMLVDDIPAPIGHFASVIDAAQAMDIASRIVE
jgi:hypothetical protein